MTGTALKALGTMSELVREILQQTSNFNILSKQEDAENFLRAQGRGKGIIDVIDHLFTEAGQFEEEEKTDDV